jgi:hypothetical protein
LSRAEGSFPIRKGVSHLNWRDALEA